MEFSAAQIAELLKGNVEGDPEIKVDRISKIEEGEPGSLTFLANPKYTEYIYSTNASVVLVNKDFEAEKPFQHDLTLVRVEDAYQSLATLLSYYDSLKKEKKGIENPSYISDEAKLGEEIYVGAFAYVSPHARIGNKVQIHPHCYIGENAEIGDHTILKAGVKVQDECKVGKDCILHAGVTIGNDGFGFAPNSENNYQKVAQTGNVIIEDHVEVGSNSTIDRATLGSTVIHKGVKLDNLVQVAHNVEIGENTVIAAQTGIAGSTKIGSDCMIGGQVGIIGHLKIANKVKIAAQSGIGHSIDEEGAIVQGSPAFEIGEYKRAYVGFRNLPRMKKQIDQLEEELKRSKESTKE